MGIEIHASQEWQESVQKTQFPKDIMICYMFWTPDRNIIL